MNRTSNSTYASQQRSSQQRKTQKQTAKSQAVIIRESRRFVVRHVRRIVLGSELGIRKKIVKGL
jgi:hypothetical protein